MLTMKPKLNFRNKDCLNYQNRQSCLNQLWHTYLKNLKFQGEGQSKSQILTSLLKNCSVKYWKRIMKMISIGIETVSPKGKFRSRKLWVKQPWAKALMFSTQGLNCRNLGLQALICYWNQAIIEQLFMDMEDQQPTFILILKKYIKVTFVKCSIILKPNLQSLHAVNTWITKTVN